MRSLIKKIIQIFNKPSYNKPSYNKKEVLELLEMEAYSFCPDAMDDSLQKHSTEIDYRGGIIRLQIHVRVYVKDDPYVTYDEPLSDIELEVILVDFEFEMYDKDGHEIVHSITDCEIGEALQIVESNT